ncbi:MAG: flagellar motor switch protein FliM [Deltaproteobacteria bacterium]
MREILTQEEVDALLEACDKGEIGENPPSPATFCTPFDFHSRKQVGNAQQAVIEMILDAVAKGVAAHLSGALRREVRVTPSPGYAETSAEFLSRFKGPSCVGLITAENRPGNVFLAVTPFLAYSLIDLMLGGEGKIECIEEKEFSPLELRLVRRILEGITAEVARGWSLFAPLRLRFGKVETNPKLLPSREDPDPLYVASFRLEEDGGLSRDFSVALPFPFVESLNAAPVPETRDPKTELLSSRILERVRSIPVEVTGILGEAHLPVREILSLKPGDVIATTREVTAPVVLAVDGKPKLAGRPGVSNGRRAVKILAR